ncbi:13100_t:CDS:1 [Funneliformis mosseae]|uniref:13100_t:CDS:1 n=1 Tax=Funneliformis mosseae TaxID=27381 RepID=A0A9N8VEU7_FUNMO|nr:13100_t:CDS:1 [Funneliformis mosseae]
MLPININTSASDFTKEDLKALKVRFQPAPSEGHAIPDKDFTEFPQQYVCPKISKTILNEPDFNVDNISEIPNNSVRSFIYTLHDVTRNLGIPETRTNSMVEDLLRIAMMNGWPLSIM